MLNEKSQNEVVSEFKNLDDYARQMADDVGAIQREIADKPNHLDQASEIEARLQSLASAIDSAEKCNKIILEILG